MPNDPQSPRIVFSDKKIASISPAFRETSVVGNSQFLIVRDFVTFMNKYDKQLDGELIFPLPDHASIVSYMLNANSRPKDEVFVEKEKPKSIYEEYRSNVVNINIKELEFSNNTFRTQIRALIPKQNRTIRIVYKLPLNLEKHNCLTVVDNKDFSSVIA